MNKKKKKTSSSNTAISIIISFLMSIFLTLLMFLCGAELGIFNKTVVFEAVNKTSYFSSVVESSIKIGKTPTLVMGLDESVLQGVFDVGETSAFVKENIMSSLDGKEFEPDVSIVKNRLIANVNKYLNSTGVVPTELQQQSISEYADTIMAGYINHMSIPYINYYVSFRTAFNGVFKIGAIVLSILVIFAAFLITRLHHYIHRSLRYITYATLSSVIMTSVLPIAGLISGVYKRINVSPEYFYNFVVNYARQSLVTFLYVAVGVLAVSAVMIIIIVLKRKAVMEKMKNKH